VKTDPIAWEIWKVSMRSILFICTANICRSPMAMGLMRARVEREAGEWRVDSAGIWAHPGLPPAQFTREVLQARGIDLGDYVSRPLTREMIEEFNLILTMERNQREALRAAFPQHTGKIFVLSQMAGNKVNDIVDPVGGPLVDFEDTAREIEQILEKGHVRIRKLAAGGKTASLTQS
jgi:protein-tyrosine-phosphatase